MNYVDDALYYSNNEDFRMKFENSLKKRFNLSLVGQAKWYLGMKIKQPNVYITLDQEQYIKNITSRFKKLSNLNSRLRILLYLVTLFQQRRIHLQLTPNLRRLNLDLETCITDQ